MKHDFSFASADVQSADVGLPIAKSHYYAHESGGRERLAVKPPTWAISETPLPKKTRQLLSDPGNAFLQHEIRNVPDGGILASQSSYHSTYLHLAAGYRIIDDIGDFHSLKASPLYSAAQVVKDGTRFTGIEFESEIRRPGRAIPLTFAPDLHTFHSHFLIQCLPRIRIARILGDDIFILVPEGLRAKQRDMLVRLGISEARMVTIQSNTIVRFDELIVPTPWSFWFSPFTIEIYKELSETLGSNVRRMPDRVLISRAQRTSWRNLNSFASLERTLIDKHGFELIRPEQLTLDEEIKLYSETKVIAGAEGAGLYSAVFSSAGTVVLSISDEDYSMPILGSAASCRGFDVCNVFGESFRSDADIRRLKPNGHCDFIVDPKLIDRAIAIIS